MAAPIPSSSILLIEPAPELREIIHHYFPSALVHICSSFENAVTYMPLNLYQVVICPQSIAALDGYALLSLSQLHHPCSPFIVTTERQEVADVRHAIDQGALGFLHGTTTTSNIIRIIEGLLALYQLRFSLERRKNVATNFDDQLRRNPIHMKTEMLSSALQDNPMMCEQSLTAQANHLVSEARQRMWDY